LGRTNLERLAVGGALLLILLNLTYLGWIGWHAAWWDFYFTRAEKALTQGKVAAAETDYLEALKYAELMVPSDGRLARTYHDLGMIHWGQLRYAEARVAFDRALRLFQRYDGPNSYFVGVVRARQGEIALQQGDLAGAEASLREAADILQRCVGSQDSMTVRSRASLGLSLFYQGRREEARHYLMAVARLVQGNAKVGDLVYQNQVKGAMEAVREVH